MPTPIDEQVEEISSAISSILEELKKFKIIKLNLGKC